MLSIKQREERDALVAKREGLREELAFAVEHKKPWQWGSWESGEVHSATCEMHGDYQRISLTGKAYRGVENVKHSQCPECVKAELADIESSLRALRVSYLIDNAGIARRFEACEFANYQAINQDAAKNLASCQRYTNSWPERLKAGTGLVMTGNCGTGKNHLAVSIAKTIIRDHLAKVEITDVMRLTRAVKSTWRHNAEMTEEDVIERFASLDLLIIDEVGVQFGSPTEMTILQEIINARYESILPTILISNLTFDQLKETIGERIVDRVTDGGRNRLAFGWGSFRAIASGVVA
ncbi:MULTISPECIES: ATP-binding protein [Enterobacteriaceae]|jgi:DNA replication protein DnaC|uniref:ATP-binding protein n=1 Tax=Enterobacteriaceae TaxID=543 RepID=UPI00044DAA08|nr:MULTISPECIES: ATP-binding protein [Enterobacter cloacae complex]AWR68502.1 AAA family ATPase [Enterobacter hormaechei subsp. xiangfangensis]AXL99304.1 AAA family ATPase [Enterobacter hormaechei subsp. xiangfangensis]EHK3212243.1 ATP-binding protein [Enterobacter hormaechei]EHK3217222.1 ATP-binding protein [Enterobacter hormaechei]EHK3224404.1 ATP-binding protein [Enterobacter hormaechei]